MRVLHFGKYHWSSPGGVERYLGELHTHLKLPCYRVDSDFLVFQKPGTVPVRCDGDAAVHGVKIFGTLRSMPVYVPSRIIANVLRKPYDLLHFHHPNPSMQPLLSYALKRNPSAKLIVSWHCDIVRQRLLKRCYQPFQRRLIRRADRIIVATSTYLATSPDLADLGWKCQIIPYGLSEKRGAPRTVAGRGLLAVGRLVPYKGFEYLLEAMALPQMSGYQLTVIGDGPLRESLERMRANRGLSDRVTLLSRVSDEVLAEHYQESSLLVLPSVNRTEAFGIVLLEAMASGMPVVTTAIGSGMEDIVRDGIDGRVVAPRSPDALCAAIRSILEDEAIYRRMSRSALERFRTKYRVEHHMEQLCDLYRLVVNER